MKNIVFVLALVIFARVASRDACAATALLEVTRPVGGEVYLVGQTQQVRVTSKLKSVTIQISRDGGATFTDLGVIDNTVKDKTLQNLLKYTVTGPANNNCIVRASGAAKGEVVAESGGFVITTGNTLAPVITTDLADGSVTTPKLADGAVTSAKVNSGAASAGFLLTADGAGGADWAALDTVGLDSRYVLKAGDKMTGALTLSGNPTLALHAAPKQYVDAETTRAQNTETLLTTLLLGEATRASNAESTLTTNLNAEVTRAQGAEGTLTTALSAEVTRAQGAEGTLTTALSAEKTRAQAAENTLTTALNAEVTARTSAGTTLQTNIDGKVSKAGDTMSGALTLNGNPVASLHAAPKQYVDAETTRAQSAEGTLTTNLTAETTARTGADTALQASINTKVAKAGDTMSGPLVLSGDPSLNLHAATKQYVDAETTRAQAAEGTLTTNLSAEITRATAAESTLTSGKVAKAGDTMSGLLVLSGNPVLALHAAPKQYVDAETTRAQGAEGTLTTNLSAEITRATAAESTLTTSVSGKVAKAGDTMTGALTLSGDPTLNLHAATKQYVDAEKTRAQGAEGTLTTNLSNEVARATAAEGMLTTNLNEEISRATAAEGALNTNVNAKVSKAGDTMTGTLIVSGDGKKLVSQSTSIDEGDATIGKIEVRKSDNSVAVFKVGSVGDVAALSLTAAKLTLTGGAGDLKVLTSDAIGNATWQTSPNLTPVPLLTVSQTVTFSGVVATLDATASYDPEGTALQYAWDFLGNGTFTPYAASVGLKSQTYSTFSGYFMPTVRVKDAAGRVAESKALVRTNDLGLQGTLVDDSIGYISLAVVSGRPAISYCDVANSDLMFAINANPDGSGAWVIQTVDHNSRVNFFTSLAVISGLPAIAYYDADNADLKFAINANADGSGIWTIQTVDSVGDVGRYASLAVVNGKPAISYRDGTNGILKFAINSNTDGSGAWAVQTVDSSPNVGMGTSLALINGSPAISYRGNGTELRFAINANVDGSGAWNIAIVTNNSSEFLSALTLVNGRPAIAYQGNNPANNNPLLGLSINTNVNGLGAWTSQTVDAAVTGGAVEPSLAVINGKPAISYYDANNGALKYAVNAAVDASGIWSFAVIDNGGVGQYSSLKAMPDGKAGVAYWDSRLYKLKFAKDP